MNPKSSHRARTAETSHRLLEGRSAAWWAAGVGLVAAGVGTALFNKSRAKDAEAANRPVGKFIEIDGTRLHYVEKGSGSPIILLHGNGTMIQDWLASGVFDSLARSNRVIAIDRPGFGYSDRRRTVLWTPAVQARLIAAAMSALGVTRATIVGHSLGTMVAVQLGLDHPELVSSLVLISGYYYPTARPDVALAAPPVVPIVGDVIRHTVSPLFGRALQGAVELQMFAPAKVPDGWREEFPFAMTLRPSQIRASAADGAMMIPAAAASASRLHLLTGPVTIIAGAGDLVAHPDEQSGRLARALPQSRLLMVEGVGHMVHHSVSVAVASAIRQAAS